MQALAVSHRINLPRYETALGSIRTKQGNVNPDVTRCFCFRWLIEWYLIKLHFKRAFKINQAFEKIILKAQRYWAHRRSDEWRVF